MYNIWPLIIILVSLLVILFIVIRRFPALAVLDVDNIPEEKEQQIKEKIIKDRMRRKFSYLNKFFSFFGDFFIKFSKFIGEGLENFKKKQESKIKTGSLANVSQEEKMRLLFSQAKEMIKNEEIKEAEQKLIEIISLDDKNLLAFSELGYLYYDQGKLQEAKQTLLYALKLADISNLRNEQAEINYNLSLIAKDLNDNDGAVLNLLKALEKDQNNPRYLDLMLDLCIIKKDKKLALEYLERIKEVNPDNQNIASWEESISEINN